jgi:hypothetical protein
MGSNGILIITPTACYCISQEGGLRKAFETVATSKTPEKYIERIVKNAVRSGDLRGKQPDEVFAKITETVGSNFDSAMVVGVARTVLAKKIMGENPKQAIEIAEQLPEPERSKIMTDTVMLAYTNMRGEYDMATGRGDYKHQEQVQDRMRALTDAIGILPEKLSKEISDRIRERINKEIAESKAELPELLQIANYLRQYAKREEEAIYRKYDFGEDDNSDEMTN